MTGFLTHEWLRTHQTSFDLRRMAALERPRLVAIWSVGPEGRPVCHWSICHGPACHASVERWNDEDDPH
jgi:hypothetical protein